MKLLEHLRDKLIYKTYYSDPITLMDVDMARKWVDEHQSVCPLCQQVIKPYIEAFCLENSSVAGISVYHHRTCGTRHRV